MKKIELNAKHAAILMVFGVMMSVFGFHDFDSAQNWRWLNCFNERYGAPPIVDCNLLGMCVESSEQYRIGIGLLFAGFYTTAYSAYLFGKKMEKLECGSIGKL